MEDKEEMRGELVVYVFWFSRVSFLCRFYGGGSQSGGGFDMLVDGRRRFLSCSLPSLLNMHNKYLASIW